MSNKKTVLVRPTPEADINETYSKLVARLNPIAAGGAPTIAAAGHHAPPDASEQYFTCADGRRFPRKFVYGLIAQIIARVPLLVRGHEYTLRKICGEGYWLCLEKVQVQDAGRCVLQLCKAPNVVPLIDTGIRDSANAHLYLIA